MFISRLIFEIYSKIVFFFYTPLKVTGLENIPKDRGVIFSSNHNSHSDTAIIAIASNFGYNRLAMLAASDYWFDNPFRKFFFRLILNLIPIDRGRSKPDKKVSLEQTIALCRNFVSKPKHGIVMYPEGTRSLTGKLQKLKDGVSLFSARMKVPIVPIYIKGSYHTWRKGWLFIRPRKLFVEFLPPIIPEKIEDEFKKLNIKSKETFNRTKMITSVLYDRLLKAERKHEVKVNSIKT